MASFINPLQKTKVGFCYKILNGLLDDDSDFES